MEKDNTLRVAVIQQRSWADKERSLDESDRLIRQAVDTAGPRLILLQELHATHYFCQSEDSANFDLAEALDGPTAQRLAGLAKQHRIVLVGSLFEKRAAGVYHNTAVIFDQDGSLAGFYRKMHVPDDPGFYEKFYFAPGDAVYRNGRSGFSPIQTSIGRLGVLVCWDQWYPEAARLMAIAGAELLLYPTAIGWDPRDDSAEQLRQHEAWRLVQRAHAVANQLPVLVANRVGHEPAPGAQGGGIRFWGGSFICGAQGELLAEGDVETAQVVAADVNLANSELLRRIWPFFRDRRIDAYQGLTQRVLES